MFLGQPMSDDDDDEEDIITNEQILDAWILRGEELPPGVLEQVEFMRSVYGALPEDELQRMIRNVASKLETAENPPEERRAPEAPTVESFLCQICE